MLNTASTADPALAKAFHIATDQASTAIRKWTGGSVALSLDEVHEVPIEEAIASIQLDDEPLSIIVLQIAGEYSGDMMLAFAESDANSLVEDLASSVRGADLSEEWKQSALMESGNILASAYLNALTDLVEEPLFPTPPHLIQDYGVSVFEQLLMQHAMFSDKIFLTCTTFRRNETDVLNGNLFFIPGEQLRSLMVDRLPS